LDEDGKTGTTTTNVVFHEILQNLHDWRNWSNTWWVLWYNLMYYLISNHYAIVLLGDFYKFETLLFWQVMLYGRFNILLLEVFLISHPADIFFELRYPLFHLTNIHIWNIDI
jgi:hypothetical protein